MISSNFLAPIDGYTDLPFRLLCQKHGAGAACVPLVSATAIAFNNKKSLIDAHPDEKNIGIQLVGSEPGHFAIASKAIIKAMPFIRWLNINCGCPSARTKKCGSGSEMLNKPDSIASSIILMKNEAGIPISVKLRIKENKDETIALCKKIEAAGADFLIIHARTAKAGYAGKADWDLIKAIKEKMDIPVVGNGDICTASEGRMRIEGGYCDSFMAGRAAMANPMLFSDKEPDGFEGRIALLKEYISLHEHYLGELKVNDVKLKAVNFVSCVPKASGLRTRIYRAESIDGIMAILDAP